MEVFMPTGAPLSVSPAEVTKTQRVIKSILEHLTDKQKCGFDFKTVHAENPDVNKGRISLLGKKLRNDKWQPPPNFQFGGNGKPSTGKTSGALVHEADLADVTGKKKLFSFEIGDSRVFIDPNDLMAAYQHYLKLQTKYGFKWPFSDFLRSGARYYTALYVLTEEGLDGEQSDSTPNSTGELRPRSTEQVRAGIQSTPN
jgi:hypothetical protein